MTYLKGTQWLAPYIKSVNHLIPLQKLVKLQAFKIHLKKETRADGSCNFISRGKYSIAIRLWCRNEKRTRHILLYLHDVLYYLAHELAHIKEWEHTPKHYKLQAKILKRFAEVAQSQGIKDMYTRNYNHD